MQCTYDAYGSRGRIAGMGALLALPGSSAAALKTVLSARCHALLEDGRLSSVSFPLRYRGVPWEFGVRRGYAGYAVSFACRDGITRASTTIPPAGSFGRVSVSGDAEAGDEMLNLVYGMSVTCVPPDAARVASDTSGGLGI